MTIEQAMELIHGVAWRGSRPGLARVRELLHRLGDPQDGLQFVHIAGTNGKGSTAAMLASILRAAGYTTGLFTSPYLERFAERMQVNGVPVPDAEFAAVCEALQPFIAAMDDPPTEFELVTAAAMLWFQRRGCDIGRTTYAKYEAGELNVRVSVLLALKRLYGCPYDAFFAGLDTADDAEAR